MGNKWSPHDWFGDPRKMTIGAEVELVIFDAKTNGLLTDREFHRAEEAFARLPDNVWKDHYSWQLEIRSDPFDDPKKVVDQLKTLRAKADAEFKKRELYIIPIPWAEMGEPAYCGTHVHIRYTEPEYNKKFYEYTWNALPFVYALADLSKNADESWLNVSDRMANSRHIGIPWVTPHEFWAGRGNMRYKDITVNNQSSADEENPKTRLKKISTLETRIFDTPSFEDHLRFIMDGTYGVFSRIRADAPIIANGGPTKWLGRITATRKLAITQRYGTNVVLGNESNFSVCDKLTELFDLKVPEETQFDFRDRIVGLDHIDKKLAMRQFSW